MPKSVSKQVVAMLIFSYRKQKGWHQPDLQLAGPMQTRVCKTIWQLQVLCIPRYAIKNPAVKSPDFYYRNYYEKILENFWNNEIS